MLRSILLVRDPRLVSEVMVLADVITKVVPALLVKLGELVSVVLEVSRRDVSSKLVV